MQHWADGGATKLSNLVSLCRFHHRAVHEGGVCIDRLDDGAWRFVLPNGARLESCARGHTLPMGDWRILAVAHERSGLRIDARTAATRWCGERMDYGMAIDGLLYRQQRALAANPVDPVV